LREIRRAQKGIGWRRGAQVQEHIVSIAQGRGAVAALHAITF